MGNQAWVRQVLWQFVRENPADLRIPVHTVSRPRTGAVWRSGALMTACCRSPGVGVGGENSGRGQMGQAGADESLEWKGDRGFRHRACDLLWRSCLVDVRFSLVNEFQAHQANSKGHPDWRRNRHRTSIKYIGAPEPAFHAPNRVPRYSSSILSASTGSTQSAIGSEGLSRRGWLGEHRLNPHTPLPVRLLFLCLAWCLQQGSHRTKVQKSQRRSG
ncbi:hypothetical protein QBC47DRAFT_157563 [Echria macrotheca]|uniref:Uncharacterized protein n=1 Tax=Echria macrotheca TaxID=438768 RepID=A0AAJ0BFU8_9PEZI|nr:hypothetical protein QBC47DRAFT_157563 [Echria macrotheca]